MAQKFHSLHETGSLPIFFYITRWAYSLYYFLTLQLGSLTHFFYCYMNDWTYDPFVSSNLWSICFLNESRPTAHTISLIPSCYFFFFLGHIFTYHIKLLCCPSSNTLKKKNFKPLIFLLSAHFPRNPFKQRKVFMWEKPTPLG